MASSGVNVKMGVSGVAQFKQNMNQAKQAVKTLDAQLALSEKQFKQTGDSQGYMAEKSALLDAKLENQKKILAESQRALEDMASKGIDKSSKAYQDMYRAMIEAKGAIIDTENAMAGITDEGDKAASQVSEMNAQLKNINKGVSFQNVTDGIGKITSAAEGAIKKAVDLGKAIVREILGAGDWADDLGTRAQFYQISEEELQRMDKTARLIDTPVDAIINAKKKLKKELAGEGQKDMGAYAALGINPNDAKDADDLFWRVGEAIMKETDEVKQEAYAQELLGRSWNELIPLFEAGREEYEKTKASWNIVPQEQIDALKAMNDQYVKLEEEFNTVKTTFMGEMAPALESVMKTLTDLLAKFNEYLASDEGKAAMEALGDAVTKLVEDLVNVDPDAVVNGIAKAIDDIKGAFEWIENNKDTIKNALIIIAGGFAMLKVGEVATNVWRAVDGFNQLRGGGGGNTSSTPATSSGGGGGGGGGGAAAAGGGTAAGGATAKTGFFSNVSGIGGYLGEMALGYGVAAIPLAAFAGAVVLNNKSRDEAQKKYDELASRAQEAAKEMGEEAEAQAKMVEDMTNMLGYTKDENGNYNTGLFGTKQMGDWGMIGETAEDFAALRGVEQAKLYNKIRQYMPYTESGFDTIKTLEKVRAGTAEQWEKQDLVQAIAEAYTLSMEAQGAMDAYDRMTEAADDMSGEGAEAVKNGGKDIKDAADKMSKIPGETAAAVRESLSDVRIYIDGDALAGSVGEIMAGKIIRFGT